MTAPRECRLPSCRIPSYCHLPACCDMHAFDPGALLLTHFWHSALFRSLAFEFQGHLAHQLQLKPFKNSAINTLMALQLKRQAIESDKTGESYTTKAENMRRIVDVRAGRSGQYSFLPLLFTFGCGLFAAPTAYCCRSCS